MKGKDIVHLYDTVLNKLIVYFHPQSNVNHATGSRKCIYEKFSTDSIRIDCSAWIDQGVTYNRGVFLCS